MMIGDGERLRGNLDNCSLSSSMTVSFLLIVSALPAVILLLTFPLTKLVVISVESSMAVAATATGCRSISVSDGSKDEFVADTNDDVVAFSLPTTSSPLAISPSLIIIVSIGVDA